MKGPDTDVHNNDTVRWDVFGNNHFHKKPGLKDQQADPAQSIRKVSSHPLLMQTFVLRRQDIIERTVFAL